MLKHRIKKLALLSMFLFLALPVYALDLDDAKQNGLVGEQLNGYLGVVTTRPTSEVRSLVEEINKARKQKYQQIANQNGTSLTTVEALAGEKAIEKTSAGHYVQTAVGWKKK